MPLPRNSIRAKAYPAIAHSSSWPTTRATVTAAVVRNWLKNGICSKTAG